MKIDLKELQKRMDADLIRVQKHPDLDLYIYNYTEVCQFTKTWDDYTLMCRGLILDGQGEVVARAFDKFFNLGEGYVPETDPDTLETIMAVHGTYSIEEKLDGSLGIVFWYGSEWHVATRGSFISDQAVEAKKILRNFENFEADKNLTHLFEVIYPENRIVVNYGKDRKLIYLGSRHPDNADYFIDPWIFDHFTMPKRYSVAAEHEDNAEGYVFVFSDTYRIKVKFEEYKRLHKLVTGLSEKAIWEILKDGKDLKELLAQVPDEFYEWASEVATRLHSQFNAADAFCKGFYKGLCERVGTEDRKVFALEAVKFEYPGLLFSMLDGKDYSEALWKNFKPEKHITFKEDDN